MKSIDKFDLGNNKTSYLLLEEPCILSTDVIGEYLNFDYYNPVYLKTLRKIEKIGKLAQLEPDVAKVTRITGWDTTKHVQYLDEEIEDVSEGIPFLRVQNVLPFKIDIEFAETKYITKEAHKKLKNSQIKPGDIVMTITGRVGSACVKPNGFRECNASQEVVRIRPKDGYDPYYLVAFLNSDLGKHQLQRLQTGSSRPRTLIKNVRKIKIIPPSTNTEKLIIKNVQNLESEIKRIENEIANHEEQIRHFITQRFNIQPSLKEWKYFEADIKERFDVKYYDPKIKQFQSYMKSKSKELSFKYVPLKEIVTFPAKIEKDSTGKIIRYNRWDPRKKPSPDGRITPNSIFKHVRISNMDYRYCEITSYSEYMGKEAPGRARVVLYENDIITATSGSATGTPRHKTGIVTMEFDRSIATTGFTKLRIKNDENGKPLVLPYYLVGLLRSDFVLDDIKRRTRGSTIPNINEDDLLDVMVPVPLDDNIQKVMADKIEELIKTLKSKLNELEEKKISLIQELEDLFLLPN